MQLSSDHEKNLKHQQIYILAGAALFLSMLELIIPRPLPFMKIGLANTAVILGIYMFGFRDSVKIVLWKTFLQGLLSGTIFSYAFLLSIGGSFASFLVMFLLYKTARNLFSIPAISCAGALASNSVQILISYLFIFGKPSILFAPFFLIAGTVSSIILGIFAAEVLKVLEQEAVDA